MFCVKTLTHLTPPHLEAKRCIFNLHRYYLVSSFIFEAEVPLDFLHFLRI